MIEPETRGKCPHCLTVVQFVDTPLNHHAGSSNWSWFDLKTENDRVRVGIAECPNCHRPIISMEKEGQARLVYPLGSGRPPVPSEVPRHIAEDYSEACLVIPFSPKASAALSRRCLQAVLREAGGSAKNNLVEQIDEVLPKLPSHLQKSLDAVRNIGNFATHPMKSQSTGTIVDVEPGEAEWNLDTLEALFDFYYVQPKILEEKRKALDKKLKDAGKPPLK